MTDEHPRTPTTPVGRLSRSDDIGLTILFLIIGTIAAIIGLCVGFLSIFLTATCSACDHDLIDIVWGVLVAAPPLVFGAFAAGSIVRLVRHRVAWWLPLVGIVLGVAVWVVAYSVLESSIR